MEINSGMGDKVKLERLAITLRRECVKWLRLNLDYKIKGLNRTIQEEIQI